MRDELIKIYRRAADLVDSDDIRFACWAIAFAEQKSYSDRSRAVTKFEEQFKPEDTASTAFFTLPLPGGDHEEFRTGTFLGRTARAIALDLMAEILETESN